MGIAGLLAILRRPKTGQVKGANDDGDRNRPKVLITEPPFLTPPAPTASPKSTQGVDTIENAFRFGEFNKAGLRQAPAHRHQYEQGQLQPVMTSPVLTVPPECQHATKTADAFCRDIGEGHLDHRAAPHVRRHQGEGRPRRLPQAADIVPSYQPTATPDFDVQSDLSLQSGPRLLEELFPPRKAGCGLLGDLDFGGELGPLEEVVLPRGSPQAKSDSSTHKQSGLRTVPKPKEVPGGSVENLQSTSTGKSPLLICRGPIENFGARFNYVTVSPTARNIRPQLSLVPSPQDQMSTVVPTKLLFDANSRLPTSKAHHHRSTLNNKTPN